MRLLVFEFITGGGFVNDILPASLMQEGRMMRDALLQDLRSIENLQLLVLSDERVEQPQESEGVLLDIKQGTDLVSYLQNIKADYDAVWLIAPETDGILVNWQQFFKQENKQVCLSTRKALMLCQNKLETTHHLQKAGINCVSSQKYQPSITIDAGSWVLKPIDSVGCEDVYLIETEQQWLSRAQTLDKQREYLIQPYIKGVALSLSALFYQGKATFICCNQQHLNLKSNEFQLHACTVNVQQEQSLDYQILCSKIAQSIPGLWGYSGIDLIKTEQGELVILEINPRLTTSYVGIKQATGINVAAQVLGLLDNRVPDLTRTRSNTVLVKID